MTSRAAAPSEICEALPAWMTPSSLKDGLSPASDSAVVPRRMPSSAVTGRRRSTPGRSGRSNAPASCAAAARACERAEYSSSWVREKSPLLGDQLRTDALVEREVVRSGQHLGPYGMPVGAPTPSGTRLIDSTPPATTTSCWPDITACAANSSACWLDPQARLTVVPGIVSGQPAASTA